jgi:DNA-binding response OmpR family regulator
MNVLIVEDQALIAMCLAEELEAAGYMVMGPAATGDEARELVKSTTPDVALIDIDLDAELAGVELARELTHNGVDCLFVTGKASIARQNTDAALGCIAKPYSVAEVCLSLDVLDARHHPSARGPCLVPSALELY